MKKMFLLFVSTSLFTAAPPKMADELLAAITDPLAQGSNLAHAVQALQKGDYKNLWNWYEALDEDSRASILQELVRSKTPYNIPHQISAIRQRIQNLRRFVETSREWNDVLFPPPEPPATATTSSSSSVFAEASPDTSSSRKQTRKRKVETAPPLKLISKDGKEFELPRTAAQNVAVSGLTARALEEEATIANLQLPRITGTILTQIMPLLRYINQRTDVEFGQLPAAEARELMEKVSKRLGSVSFGQLPAMIDAANYLDSQLLLHTLLYRYTQYIGLEVPRSKAKERLEKDNIALVLWPIISKYYFLQHNEDLEPILFPGKKNFSIPFDVLVAYGKLPQNILDDYPNLKEKPNDEVTTLVGLPPQRLPLHVAVILRNIPLMRALLRLPGIDVNARDSAGKTAFQYRPHHHRLTLNAIIHLRKSAGSPDFTEREMAELKADIETEANIRRILMDAGAKE